MATTSKFKQGDVLTYTGEDLTSIKEIIFVAYRDADIAEVTFHGDRYCLPLSKLELQKRKVDTRRLYEGDTSYVDA